MNNLLIFFAIPVATVILTIVLQKILKCPLLVAATFFAIFLIVTFAAFDVSFLVFAILYTILSYVTAVLVKVICKAIEAWRNLNNGNSIVETEALPITINNTTPCTNIKLANDANLITNRNATRRNNCNCCGRR